MAHPLVDELLNHFISSRGICSCGTYAGKTPDQVASHIASVVSASKFFENECMNAYQRGFARGQEQALKDPYR